MSNEMISVPRDKLTTLIAQCLNGAGGNPDLILEELRALLAKPAEQPKGELVAWTWVGALDELKNGASTIPVYRNEGPGTPVALYTHPAEQSAPVAVVPEGRQLVPAVPTDDMIVAFAEAWYSKRQAIDDPDMLDAYKAMLAVAPN